MGPRRTSLVLALLALGLLVASAGVAAACVDAPVGSGSTGSGVAAQDSSAAPGGQGSDHASGDAGQAPGQGTVGGTGNGSGNGSGATGTGGDSTRTWIDGHSCCVTGSPGGDGGSGVEGSSVGTPPAPAEAPPATASGPAPDAVAAAPISTPAEQVIAPAFVPAVGGGGTTAAPAAALVATPAPANPSVSLGELPDLGSIGKVAPTAAAGSSVARTLLSTGTGRPIAIVLGLLGAILLFLSIHRRVDRSDPKLAAANAVPDVARFR